MEKAVEVTLQHKKQIAILFIIAIIAGGTGTAVRKYREQQLYEGEFYVCKRQALFYIVR